MRALEQTVGERLAQTRRLLSFVLARDVSQDELAVMAGLANGSMSQWEKGHKRPSRDTLQRIIAVLHKHGMAYITLGWLDYGEGEGPPSLGVAPPAPKRAAIPLEERPVSRVRKRKAKRKGA